MARNGSPNAPGRRRTSARVSDCTPGAGSSPCTVTSSVGGAAARARAPRRAAGGGRGGGGARRGGRGLRRRRRGEADLGLDPGGDGLAVPRGRREAPAGRGRHRRGGEGLVPRRGARRAHRSVGADHQDEHHLRVAAARPPGNRRARGASGRGGSTGHRGRRPARAAARPAPRRPPARARRARRRAWSLPPPLRVGSRSFEGVARRPSGRARLPAGTPRAEACPDVTRRGRLRALPPNGEDMQSARIANLLERRPIGERVLVNGWVRTRRDSKAAASPSSSSTTGAACRTSRPSPRPRSPTTRTRSSSSPRAPASAWRAR